MTPANENELAEMIRGASGPIRIAGGGTRGAVSPGELLSTSGLAGVTLYEPGALTLVVKAGTPLAEIEAALDNEGQRLAFEPPDLRALLGTAGSPTIGGIVATNGSGPRRIQVGACRDHLLGVRFVDGTGTIIKNGGRVMKNVTGYDLVKLLAGSWGTLGVLAEVSLKVLPKPEAVATLMLEGLSDGIAVAAMSAALGSPYDVTGAAHFGGRTLVRLEGFADSVRYRSERLSTALAGFGEINLSAGTEYWNAIRDVTVFADKQGDVWRLSVRPSDAAELADELRKGGEVEIAYDWGGGLMWVLSEQARDLRPAITRGHATLVRASDETRQKIARFQPEVAPVAAISAGLRARFDPRGILNPGVMG